MNVPLTPLRCLRYAEQQYPRRTAVVCGELRFTYAQFAERAARLAGALRAAGVNPGDRVAFLSMNCHRLLEAYYGVLDAGAVRGGRDLAARGRRRSPSGLRFLVVLASHRQSESAERDNTNIVSWTEHPRAR